MVSQSDVLSSVIEENPEKAQQIAKQCAMIVSDKKAEDVSVLSVSKLTSYADFLVVCSATSERHTQSLSRLLVDEVKLMFGLSPIGVEGRDDGKWILVDFGDVVFHVFTMEARGHYDLDGLWADATRIPFLEKAAPKRKKAVRLLETCES